MATRFQHSLALRRIVFLAFALTSQACLWDSELADYFINDYSLGEACEDIRAFRFRIEQKGGKRDGVEKPKASLHTCYHFRSAQDKEASWHCAEGWLSIEAIRARLKQTDVNGGCVEDVAQQCAPRFERARLMERCPGEYPFCQRLGIEENREIHYCTRECEGDMIFCSGLCVNPRESQKHCGAKGLCDHENRESPNFRGQECAAGSYCSEGVCVLGCQPSLVLCGSLCVDPLSDERHCGANGSCSTDRPGQANYKGMACPPKTECEAGRCIERCAEHELKCRAGCIDPQSHHDYCGATPKSNCDLLDGAERSPEAGKQCSELELCHLGRCIESCPKPFLACQGACIDPQSNPLFCSARGKCDQNDPMSPDFKGYSCEISQVCLNGSCRTFCPKPLENCHQNCVNIQRDPEHCGSCDNKCKPHEKCIDGDCVLECFGSQIKCGGACVDGENDPKHCGDCGQNCLALPQVSQAYCQKGKCQIVECQKGYAECNQVSSDGCEFRLEPYTQFVCRSQNACIASPDILQESSCTTLCGGLSSDQVHCSFLANRSVLIKRSVNQPLCEIQYSGNCPHCRESTEFLVEGTPFKACICKNGWKNADGLWHNGCETPVQ